MASTAREILGRFDNWLAKGDAEMQSVEGVKNSAMRDVEQLVAQATQRVLRLRNRNVVISASQGFHQKEQSQQQNNPVERQEQQPGVAEKANDPCEQATSGPAAENRELSAAGNEDVGPSVKDTSAPGGKRKRAATQSKAASKRAKAKRTADEATVEVVEVQNPSVRAVPSAQPSEQTLAQPSVQPSAQPSAQPIPSGAPMTGPGCGVHATESCTNEAAQPVAVEPVQPRRGRSRKQEQKPQEVEASPDSRRGRSRQQQKAHAQEEVSAANTQSERCTAKHAIESGTSGQAADKAVSARGRSQGKKAVKASRQPKKSETDRNADDGAVGVSQPENREEGTRTATADVGIPSEPQTAVGPATGEKDGQAGAGSAADPMQTDEDEKPRRGRPQKQQQTTRQRQRVPLAVADEKPPQAMDIEPSTAAGGTEATVAKMQPATLTQTTEGSCGQEKIAAASPCGATAGMASTADGVKKDQAPAVEAPGPMASPARPATSPKPGPGKRSNRSERGQVAGGKAPSASNEPTKPANGSGGRPKRDLREAQFGSPGLHPKTKVATEAANGASAPQDGVQQQQLAEARALFPQPAPQPAPPEPAKQVESSAPPARRMPTSILQAIAKFGGSKLNAGTVQPGGKGAAAGPADNGIAAVKSSGPSKQEGPKPPDAAAGSEGGKAAMAKDEVRNVSTGPSEDGFCFGTKPKEQRSPDMPHFGQGAEPRPHNVGATAEPPQTDFETEELAKAPSAVATAEAPTATQDVLTTGVVMVSGLGAASPALAAAAASPVATTPAVRLEVQGKEVQGRLPSLGLQCGGDVSAAGQDSAEEAGDMTAAAADAAAMTPVAPMSALRKMDASPIMVVEAPEVIGSSPAIVPDLSPVPRAVAEEQQLEPPMASEDVQDEQPTPSLKPVGRTPLADTADTASGDVAMFATQISNSAQPSDEGTEAEPDNGAEPASDDDDEAKAELQAAVAQQAEARNRSRSLSLAFQVPAVSGVDIGLGVMVDAGMGSPAREEEEYDDVEAALEESDGVSLEESGGELEADEEADAAGADVAEADAAEDDEQAGGAEADDEEAGAAEDDEQADGTAASGTSGSDMEEADPDASNLSEAPAVHVADEAPMSALGAPSGTNTESSAQGPKLDRCDVGAARVPGNCTSAVITSTETATVTAPSKLNGGPTCPEPGVFQAKVGNIVACVRSFLPQRTAPSPPPAAGKKPVKVKALEAAQAAKQKEAARAAERAQARAAAADRQGPTKPVGAPAPRMTPARPRVRPEGDAVAPQSQITAAAAAPSTATTKTTMTTDDNRTDTATTSNAAAVPGSVKARAALFEQSKRGAAEQNAVRRPAGVLAAMNVAPTGAAAHKAGAAARAALAAGDGDPTINSASESLPTSSALKPAAAAPCPSSSRTAGTAAPVPAETAADKQKRVEAKRREEEDRRRAELEARAKAKDDKLRNFEAAKLQQRSAATGAGALRAPPPPAANPLAQPTAKRQPLNTIQIGQGQASTKADADNLKGGGAGPSVAQTPSTKTAPTAAYLVSPAVQMQVKLLPAVMPPASTVKGVTAGLPRPQQYRQAPPTSARKAPPGGASVVDGGVPPCNQMTPIAQGATELTEEDQRRVHAIQTSPYVAQVKSRTPNVTCGAKSLTNYEISPYRPDSDDDEDEDDSPRPKKPVPSWAAASRVKDALRAQRDVDPDTIFGQCPKTIDIIQVFVGMPPPGPDVRGRKRRSYKQRGSSAIWDEDDLPQ